MLSVLLLLLLALPARAAYVYSGLVNIAIPTGFTDSYTIEWERFGRRYAGGVRVTF